ncbi:unnamed protein product [Toxocara canis]|uniref:Uncharacterized protein n=1 Tax=Toxocara canis TaxID=6265 RepID=A0A183VFM0_TOXCA|nr:unnamed protein product [Toxocara canis]
MVLESTVAEVSATVVDIDVSVEVVSSDLMLLLACSTEESVLEEASVLVCVVGTNGKVNVSLVVDDGEGATTLGSYRDEKMPGKEICVVNLKNAQF